VNFYHFAQNICCITFIGDAILTQIGYKLLKFFTCEMRFLVRNTHD